MESSQKTIVSDGLSEYIRNLADAQPYFKGLLDAVRHGDTEVSLIRQEVNKHIQLEWIEAIEICLVSLDNAIRKPARYIEEREEVKPIELSRSIRSRSLIHLAQHTNYISEVKGDRITPNRILNVYNEETLFTYENRFLNTLVHRLFTFVNKRYTEMIKKGMENGSALSMETAFQDGNFKGTVSVKINVAESLNADDIQDPNLKRAAQLNSVISSYLKSDFIQSMGDAYIRPPVMRTNALLKNKDLNTCLELWQFIESYDKVGYTVYVEQKAESPNKDLINKLYDDMALQYITFKHDICDVPDETTVIDEDESETEPIVSAQFDTVNDRDFNLYDSEYRKLAPVPYGTKPHKLTDQVFDIREVVSDALAADALMGYQPFEKLHTLQEIREKLLYLKRKEEARIRREEQAALRKARAALRIQEMQELSKDKFVETVRLRFSLQAKLIQSSDDIKGFYSTLKNELLSYKGVHSRLSWNYENFNIKRNNIARFVVRGKTLWLYLQLDPDLLDSEKYRVRANDSERYSNIPCAYKISSNRRVKYACELIAQMCARLELEQGEIPTVDYAMPYQETQTLIDCGLVKEEFSKKKVTEGAMPVAEPTKKVAEPVSEPTEESKTDNGEVPIWETNVLENESGEAVRLKASFTAKMIQSAESTKEYYNVLKNALLSYREVHCRTSWGYENFSVKRNNIARLSVRGRSLWLYLQLDPDQFADSKYKVKAVGRTKYQNISCAYKISSNLRVKYALELIAQMCGELSIEAGEEQNVKYSFPYQPTSALIESGQIKEVVVYTKPQIEQTSTPQENSAAEAVSVSEPVSDNENSQEDATAVKSSDEVDSTNATASDPATENDSTSVQNQSEKVNNEPSETVQTDQSGFFRTEEKVSENTKVQSDETESSKNADHRSFFAKLFSKNRKK